METIQIAATYNLLFNAALMVEQVFSPAVEAFYKKDHGGMRADKGRGAGRLNGKISLS